MPGIHLHLTFPESLAAEPVLHRLTTRFGVVPTIRRAHLEETGGWVIVEVEGSTDAVAEAEAWLAQQGVEVARIEGKGDSGVGGGA